MIKINSKLFPNISKLPLILLLASCGFSGGDYTGGESKIPGNMEKVSYSQIPGWTNDDVRYALQAFRNSCRAKIQYEGRVIPDRALLDEKCQSLPGLDANNATVRKWFEGNFQAYKIFDDSGSDTGKYTGYYSPIIPASTYRTDKYNEPLMSPPTDGTNYKGVDKKTIVNNKIGKILYWANIVDVQNIQIQGSGMIKLENGKMVKLNYAGVNDMPFKSIGEQLRVRGIKPDGGYSSDAVWTYLRARPDLAREIIYNNPRYVYFKESNSNDVIGKLGTPLSKIRSIAVDDSIYTVGLPVFIDTKLSNGTKFQRLMIAQDTGSAIRGWVRADIFFGSGESAYKYAHGQCEQGRMYILMPKEYMYEPVSK